jgi:hypothetical protein
LMIIDRDPKYVLALLRTAAKRDNIQGAAA